MFASKTDPTTQYLLGGLFETLKIVLPAALGIVFDDIEGHGRVVVTVRAGEKDLADAVSYEKETEMRMSKAIENLFKE